MVSEAFLTGGTLGVIMALIRVIEILARRKNNNPHNPTELLYKISENQLKTRMILERLEQRFQEFECPLAGEKKRKQ